MRTRRPGPAARGPAALLPSLGLEVLDILWSCYLLRERSQERKDALEAMKAVKFTQLLTDDIILRLCKLRDKDRRAASFDNVVEQLNRASFVEKSLEEYRRVTKCLKEHRNKRIAHREQGQPDLVPPLEMFDAVRLAVQVLDDLAGERNKYTVLSIDLRKELLGG